MKEIVVIGSCSNDLTVKTNQRAEMGETVIGEDLYTAFGGKGANQAIAAARLGAPVKMVGCVGEDTFGEQILANFKANKVDISNMKKVPGPSGSAHITLYNGDNAIIVVPSANKAVQFENEAILSDILDNAQIVILQQEIPLTTNEMIINYCDEQHIAVILNPAPAAPLSEALIKKVTYLTPNEHECQTLFPNLSLEQALAQYPKKLIVTLGEKGAVYHDGQTIQTIASFPTKPIDTTGAGDTFNGALAYGLTQEWSLKQAIIFANLAASLSIQKLGAQGGIPTLTEIKNSSGYKKIVYDEKKG